LLNNCQTQQFFTPASPAAAELVHSYMANTQPKSLLSLKPNEQLLSQAGQFPRVVQRPNYLTDALFKDRYDANPFHTYRHQAKPVANDPASNVLDFAQARMRFEPPSRL